MTWQSVVGLVIEVLQNYNISVSGKSEDYYYYLFFSRQTPS